MGRTRCACKVSLSVTRPVPAPGPEFTAVVLLVVSGAQNGCAEVRFKSQTTLDCATVCDGFGEVAITAEVVLSELAIHELAIDESSVRNASLAPFSPTNSNPRCAESSTEGWVRR